MISHHHVICRFLTFQVYFAYLYFFSILFFLYVFGYLLRSKRKREEKKRLRKLSKARRISNMTSYHSSEDSDGYKRQSTNEMNASISMENEYADVSHFATSNADSRLRKISKADLADGIKEGPISEKHVHPTPKKSLQWAPSVKLNSVDELPIPTHMDGGNISITSSRKSCKKMKVSDNEHSHGSFFLRVGAVGRLTIKL